MIKWENKCQWGLCNFSRENFGFKNTFWAIKITEIRASRAGWWWCWDTIWWCYCYVTRRRGSPCVTATYHHRCITASYQTQGRKMVGWWWIIFKTFWSTSFTAMIYIFSLTTVKNFQPVQILFRHIIPQTGNPMGFLTHIYQEI